MKTVLNQLIEKIETLKTLDAVINPLDVCQNLAKQLLEEEKKQIVEAYTEGQIIIIDCLCENVPAIKEHLNKTLSDVYKIKNLKEDSEDAEEYFNQTFNK